MSRHAPKPPIWPTACCGVGHGAAQVERPVHRRPQFVRPKLDQPRQRTLAHVAKLRILSDLITFGGTRGREDSGGRRPENPARYWHRSREAFRRHREREQAQCKHCSFDGPQEATVVEGERGVKILQPAFDRLIWHSAGRGGGLRDPGRVKRAPAFAVVVEALATGATEPIQSRRQRKTVSS
jgi:hypothetical protein